MSVLDLLSTLQPPITKSRLRICPPGPIDPSKPFQPEIPANTLVTLEAKNVPLNPHQRWGVHPKKHPLPPRCLTHRAPGRSPITKSRHLTCPSGPIDPSKPFQLQITVTWVTLEAKNMPPNPPQTLWGFQAKKDPLKPSFRTH